MKIKPLAACRTHRRAGPQRCTAAEGRLKGTAAQIASTPRSLRTNISAVRETPGIGPHVDDGEYR